MDIILALDVSTHCIGVTVAMSNENGLKVLSVNHLRLKIPSKIKGIEGLFLKSEIFSDYIDKLKQYNITDVVIEEPLVSSNNSLTTSTLLRFNGMISQSVYQKLGLIPKFISSYDARRFAFPELMSIRKFKKNGEVYPKNVIRRALKNNELVLFGSYQWDCEKKFILWNKISELYPEIQWVYNKKGDLTVENFDASDSMVCAIGYVNKKKYENNEPKILEWEEKYTDNGVVFNYKMEFCGLLFEKIIDLT